VGSGQWNSVDKVDDFVIRLGIVRWRSTPSCLAGPIAMAVRNYTDLIAGRRRWTSFTRFYCDYIRVPGDDDLA